MNKNIFTRVMACAVILLVSAGLALGQAGRGTARLGGVVIDKDGKPIPGAQVVAVFDQPGGSKFETVTDSTSWMPPSDRPCTPSPRSPSP